MRSSYELNNYGLLFENYPLAWKYYNIVELGILDGYSLLHLAKGVRSLHKFYGYNERKIDAYDLFDDYEFNHGNKEEVEELLIYNCLSEYVNIIKGNAYEVYRDYEDKSIELLHVDISNTGETLNRVMELWSPKIKERGMILFEGGSEERDNVEWMKSYNKPSIREELESNRIINKQYIYATYCLFPSLTVLFKK